MYVQYTHYNTHTIHDSSISLFILCCRPLSLFSFFFLGGQNDVEARASVPLRSYAIEYQNV